MKGRAVFLLSVVMLSVEAVADGTFSFPLVAVRQTTMSTKAFVATNLFDRFCEIHRQHPGSCDEVWLSWSGLDRDPALAASNGLLMATLRDKAARIGCRVSFQQGQTLGHLQDARGYYPDGDLQVDKDGKIIGYPCPRSPLACSRQRDYIAALVRSLRPSSYWLDDDLRLGVCKAAGCFCPRCLAAFNAKEGLSLTREELVARLYGKAVREPLRAAWCRFNAESLASYAKACREGVDRAGVDTMLGYQAVWSDTIYTGRDYRPILEALAGPDRKPVGIRPGAMCYTDENPLDLVAKGLSVAREAERCRAYGLVLTVCYEQDNHPRQAINKSPAATVVESALALASGADTLSEYGYDKTTDEPLDYHARLAAALSRARPYFERLSASTKRTSLGGIARFLGSGVAELPYWDLRDPAERLLACLGIPVTVEESAASNKVYFLTKRSQEALTDADRLRLKALPVVDIPEGRVPTHAERQRWLDEIDRVTGGAFPVRIDRCLRLRVLPRIDVRGKVDSVTLFNASVGETEPFEMRVRRPADARFFLQGPSVGPTALAADLRNGEWIVRMPTIPACGIVTVFMGGADDAAARHDANFRALRGGAYSGLRWIDGRELPLEGKAFSSTEAYYDRLPAAAKGKVSAAVWDLQRHAAGLQFRFKTDSDRLVFRWSLTSEALTGAFFSPAGRSGIDVYRKIGGEWRHVDSGKVRAQEENELDLAWPSGGECLVNLPPYNGIARFELGVRKGAAVTPLGPRSSGVVKPVVFYGTSITQGGCVSRPGSAYVSVAGRLADVPVVNLGFSGSGHMEDALCDLLCQAEASCYVLDTAWNMPVGWIDGRWEKFARKLHARHPDVPIVFAEPCRIEPCKHDMAARAQRVRAIYEKLKKEDPSFWRNLHLVPCEAQLPPDGEATVDGIHPSDYGMHHMGRAFAAAIKEALAL